MGTVLVREEIDAPAEAVWRLVGEFGNMAAWARGITLLRVDGSGVGALRFVESPVGLFVERCEAHDETERTLGYSIVESPWKLERYVASVRVIAKSPQTCALEWSGEFTAAAGATEDFEGRLERMYRAFITTLRVSIEQSRKEMPD